MVVHRDASALGSCGLGDTSDTVDGTGVPLTISVGNPPYSSDGCPTLGDRAAVAVLEYREGRPEALGDFVRDATPLLWNLVRSQGVDRERADDVVQTAWVAFVRSAATIKEPRAALKWLLVTTKRAAWETVRRRRDETVRQVGLPDDGDDGQALPSWDPTPEVAVLKREDHRALWEAMGLLSDRCRSLLRLVSLADRPDYKAISAALGMPVGSIGSTRGRCLAKLRDLLDAREGPWFAG